MITPDAPDRQYSTRLRTAIVLTGSGTAGAYHAGVLRALHEAGVKIDLVAGRGVGAIGAFFAAVDGGARLWEPNGLWRSASAAGFYRWRLPLRIAGWALVAAAVVFAVPLALLGVAVLVGTAGLLLTLVGLEAPAAHAAHDVQRLGRRALRADGAADVIPRLVLFVLLVGVAALAAACVVRRLCGAREPARSPRRDVAAARLAADLRDSFDRTLAELWNLIRGAAPIAAPDANDLARRYVELLSDNLGQPGFRELLVTVHDMDARRDVVFALLGHAHRPRFFGRPGAARRRARDLETFDLAGISRDHALDALAARARAAGRDRAPLDDILRRGAWRGETHRLCDRPAALGATASRSRGGRRGAGDSRQRIAHQKDAPTS